MAKQTKQNLQQTLLEQIAALTEKISELERKQQPIAAQKKRERGQPRAEVYYVLLSVPSKDLPPQAITCARVLATAANVNHIPESEAMELIEAAKKSGKLKTKQDSWHIFQYYRARLIGADHLRMLEAE